MIQTLQKSIYKHGYLIIIAAWLYTISFIVVNYWSFRSSPEKVQQQFESFLKNAETTFDGIAKDTTTLRYVLYDTSKPRLYLYEVSEHLQLYGYTMDAEGNPLLSFWNSNIVVPLPQDLEKPDGKYFVTYPNGQFEFIKQTIKVDSSVVLIIGMVPIRWDYFLNNEHLRTEFAALRDLDKRYDLDTSNSGFKIKNGDGKPLFALKEKQKDAIKYADYDTLPLTLKIVSIVLLLVFINFLAFDIVRSHGWAKGFGILVSVIFLLRIISYEYNFPFDYSRLGLFDQLVYASSSINRSLGDLLINVFLTFWIISFLKYVGTEPIKEMKTIRGTNAWIVIAGLAIFLLVMAFSASNIVSSLIVDSQISFDVSNFFSLNIHTLLSFIILCLVILSFFYLSHVVILIIKKCIDLPTWAKYFFVALLGLLYLSINFGAPTLNSNFIVLIWLLFYLLIYERRTEDLYLPLLRSSFFLGWLIIFAASVSALIIYQNRIDEIEQRKRIAEKLAMQTDPSGENLMSMAVTHFNNDFLSSNFSRFKTEASNNYLKDSLINENFSGYLNKYDTRIYTFDSAQKPLFNDDVASYEVITNIITNQSKRTDINNLYYYENSLDRFSYLFKKDITDQSGNTLGYFFVIAKPKRYKSEALYPELFKQVKDISTDLNFNYAYSIYNNGEILINFGSENFPSHLNKEDLPKVEYELRKKGTLNELWYKSGSKVVVITRKNSFFYEAVTLFAYLFGIFLFIVVLFQLAGIIFRSRFRIRSIRAAFRFSIRSQIQSTIIFISIFSFVVIGIATISFYIDRFNETNNERLVRAINLMQSEIQQQISSQSLMDDAVKIYDPGASEELENTITNVSEIHNVDVNFYDVSGVLRYSTQPYIYNKHIISEMMEPKAFYELHYDNQVKFTQQEQIGHFNYLSVYVPIKDDDGAISAYLNIPYLNSQSELDKEISDFIVTLINLNALIFVLASAIALMLTNRITRSFSLISEKMKDINLGKFNEEISWRSNDEIGALVNEYNKMVKKLEDSAQALAKSEREGAWREMARQVAHEIKNPLTPMKLSLQYLQKAIDDKKPDANKLAQRVSATLVEQIDQLAKIASDFSQFANIGNVNNEVFDLNNIMGSLINLHSTNEHVAIQWSKPSEAIFLKADRFQINRLFTNLIQNAIEASIKKEKAVIKIAEELGDGFVTVSIADEGMGIAKDRHDKIFTPNFTTKTSGTGLGLAICKGIVEKASGSIWFTTKEEEGTTFYVKLPLSDNEISA